jgi:hypothetical protein
MSRYLRWGIILPLTLLIVLAAASPTWLPVMEPFLVDEQSAEAQFECPENLENTVCVVADCPQTLDDDFRRRLCREFETIYDRNRLEFEAVVLALNSDTVDAPADEQTEASLREGIDPNAVSQLTETRLRVGQFQNIDLLHSARGRVTIWEILADTTVKRVLRLDNNFRVVNGPPDLAVYLAVESDPRTAEDLLGEDRQFLVGVLKGQAGSQNFVLPNDLDITQFASVVIFSAEYQVIYSVAPLEQPIE